MTKDTIKNLSKDQLVKYIESIGEKSYRANQILDWIYKRSAKSFSEMINIPAGLRERLNKDFKFQSVILLQHKKAPDGTIKFLFQLEDGEKIETVSIPAKNRLTVCVSTQSGCKFGCKFCASGIGGWKRNLSCAEILGQLLYVKSSSTKQPLTHVVFMGTGEPLDNYDNVLKSLRIINAEYGLNIAARRITISTCGLVPQIKRLSKEGLQFELAVSLHGYNDKTRRELMPVNRTYSIKDLISACREYSKTTNRQITFEYLLIKGLTCSKDAAIELGQLLKGIICKLNLIPYNEVSEFGYMRPSKKEILDFQKGLAKKGVHSTVRVEKGRDVSAACGQLRCSSAKSQKTT